MNWDRALSRWVADAQRVLREHGFPETWPEIQKHGQQGSRLVTCAVVVVAGAEYLRRYVEQGKTERALDRFLSICDAADEMGIIGNLATQGIADALTDSEIAASVTSLENQPVITSQFHKDLRTGFKSNRRRGRRKPKATKEELIKAIDAACVQSPRHGITVIREEVGGTFDLSGRQVGTITQHYNPLRK